MNFNEIVERSVQIRKLYHNLEKIYHEKNSWKYWFYTS